MLGGLAVLGSYGLLFTRPDAGEILWGGIPESLKPLYTRSMFVAAAGYFPFTVLLVLRTDWATARFAGGLGGRAVLLLYGLVLVFSALWMPLLFIWADAPSALGWALVRLDLLLVGVGSLGLLVASASLDPRPPRALRALAILGCLAFCFQTAVLDALVWPFYYPTP